MIFSNLFFNLLEKFEGYSPTAYRDTAGIYTIGYGSRYMPDGGVIAPDLVIDRATAKNWVLAHTTPLQQHLSTIFINVPLSQPQFDAIGLLVYNIGQTAFDNSTLRRKITINSLDYASIEFLWEQWDKEHKDGVLIINAGLQRRRILECFLYQNQRVLES